MLFREADDCRGCLQGNWVDTTSQACELINEHVNVDFVDLNCGCPIDQASCSFLVRCAQLWSIA